MKYSEWLYIGSAILLKNSAKNLIQCQKSNIWQACGDTKDVLIEVLTPDSCKLVLSYIIVLFVETTRKFITAKLSIRKPGSSSVLIICDLFNSHALFYIQKCRDLLAQTKLLYILLPCQHTKNLY